MSHHHRKRSWAPAPEPLPEGVHVIDDHTHVASVVPFAREMRRQAEEKGQPEVPVYGVDELLSQASAVGVEGIIDVGCELPNLMTAVQMALDHPNTVHAALAIHPNEAVLHGHRGVPGPDGLPVTYKPYHDTSFEDALAEVARLAKAYPSQVVAIGETGMDLFRTGEAATGIQREAFRAHIALAKELNLPMQIHDRDSHREVIETLLADGSPERTVFHSYSGDAEMAQIAKEHGWYLSFSGTVSYKGNDGIRKSVRIVGPEHIMVETDAPYLSPCPTVAVPTRPI
jgi:TatD DNase family protein